MPQALSCDLLLYADDSCLIFQHKDVKEIEKVLKIFLIYVTGLLTTNSVSTLVRTKPNVFYLQVKIKLKKLNP